MPTTLPTTTQARTVYLHELTATIAHAKSIAALRGLPWSLLALNATFYLDRYLTPPAYRSALAAARHSAIAERQLWPIQPGGAPAERELQQMIDAGTSRPLLYRWLFAQALSTGNAAQLLLAQHACEIAEIVDEQQVLPALRLGLIAVPDATLSAATPSAGGTIPSAESIEQLSRALLRYRISTRDFAERLLLLHAAHRAHQLTGVVFAAPIELLDPSEAALTPGVITSSTLKRLRIVQPHDLAQRAVTSGDPLAITTVEAGLVEAENLHGGPQLLLLAALDRATRA